MAGNVPAWVSWRLRYSVRKRQPVVTVATEFGDLSAAEQDSALATTIVAGHLYRTGAVKTALTYGLCFAAVGLPLVYIAAYHGAPKWLTLSTIGSLYAFGYLLTFALRSRRVLHRVDHRVAEVMGRSVVDVMIDHDTRIWPSLPVLARFYFTVYGPTNAQRLRRLDASFGPRHVAVQPVRCRPGTYDIGR